MALKTIQVADKPTLDEVKEELQNEDYGLEAIKTAIDSGSGGGGRQYEGVRETMQETITPSMPIGANSTSDYMTAIEDGDFKYFLNPNYHLRLNSLGGWTTNSSSAGGFKLFAKLGSYMYAFSKSANNVWRKRIADLTNTTINWETISVTSYANVEAVATVGTLIHLVGGTATASAHYIFDGTNIVDISSRTSGLPATIKQPNLGVYKDELHICGGIFASSYSYYHYVYKNNTWTNVTGQISGHYTGALLLEYNNKLHIIGGFYQHNNVPSTHHSWDGSKFVSHKSLPVGVGYGAIFIHKNKLCIGFGRTQGVSTYDAKYLDKIYFWDEGADTWGQVFTRETVKYFVDTKSKIIAPDNVEVKGDGVTKTDNVYTFSQPTEVWLYQRDNSDMMQPFIIE